MIRVALLLPLLLLTLAPSPGEAAPKVSFEQRSSEHMATSVAVTLPDTSDVDVLAGLIFARMAEVDRIMNEWKPGSPLAEVNRTAGEKSQVVPDELLGIAKRGMELGALTGGSFDISWAALWGLWDFRAKTPTLPDAKEVAKRAALVDYRLVVIDDEGSTLFLPEAGMKLGLGGIAKGWALDTSVAILAAQGVKDFLVTAGGQVYAGGRNGDRPWRVGIRDPRGAASDFFAIVEAENVSVSTSGDYERFFMIDGVRYHHILDPKTGQPARGLRSATVVSPDATLADALSTALMVMGPAKALALVETLADAECVLVDGHAQVLVSSGLKDALIVRHQPAK